MDQIIVLFRPFENCRFSGNRIAERNKFDQSGQSRRGRNLIFLSYDNGLMLHIMYFPFTLIRLSGFKHNGKRDYFMGFHCNPGEEILNLPPNRGEGFFLKRDPNYDQPQISMFNAAKCFNKV